MSENFEDRPMAPSLPPLEENPTSSAPTPTPAPAYEQMAPPPQKKKGPPMAAIIMASVILILTVLAVVVSLVFNRNKLSENPTEALNQVIEASLQAHEETPPILPDLSHMTRQPLSSKIDLALANSKGEYAIFPYNSRLTLQLDYDLATSQLFTSVNLNFEEEFLSEVYLSPEKVALKSPSSFVTKEFLTLNPSTYYKDVEEYSVGDPTLEEEISGLFDIFHTFQESTKDLPQFRENFQKSFHMIRTEYQNNLKVSFGTQEKEQTELIAVVSPKLFESFLEETATLLENSAFTYYKQTVNAINEKSLQALDFGDRNEILTGLMDTTSDQADTLRSYRLLENATVHLIVNPKTLLISHIEVEPVEIAVFNSFLEESEEALLSLNIDLKGEQYLTENMKIEFLLTPLDEDAYSSDGIHMVLEHLGTFQEDGLKGTRWELTDLDPESGVTLYYDLSWNPKETKAHNMSFKAGAKVKPDNQTFSFTARSILTINEDNFTLSDGRMALMDDTEEILAVEFNIDSAVVSSSEIKPDLTNAIDFIKYAEDDSIDLRERPFI